MSRTRLDDVLARRNQRRGVKPVGNNQPVQPEPTLIAVSQPQTTQKVPPIILPPQEKENRGRGRPPSASTLAKREATRESATSNDLQAPTPTVALTPKPKLQPLQQQEQPPSARSVASVTSTHSVKSTASKSTAVKSSSKKSSQKYSDNEDDTESVMSSTSSLTADMLNSLPQEDDDEDLSYLDNDLYGDEPDELQDDYYAEEDDDFEEKPVSKSSKQPVQASQQPPSARSERSEKGRQPAPQPQPKQQSLQHYDANYLELLQKHPLLKLVRGVGVQGVASDVVPTSREVFENIVMNAIQGQQQLTVNVVTELIESDFKEGQEALPSDVTLNPNHFDRFVKHICERENVVPKRDAIYLFQLYCEAYLMKMIKAADMIAGSGKRARIQGSDLTIAYYIYNL